MIASTKMRTSRMSGAGLPSAGSATSTTLALGASIGATWAAASKRVGDGGSGPGEAGQQGVGGGGSGPGAGIVWGGRRWLAGGSARRRSSERRLGAAMVFGPAADVFGGEAELLGGDAGQDLLGEGWDEGFDCPVDLGARRTRGRLAGEVGVGMESIT